MPAQCDLAAANWIKKEHANGDEWTLNKMRLIRERMFNKEIPNASSNKKGCVAIELFNKSPSTFLLIRLKIKQFFPVTVT